MALIVSEICTIQILLEDFSLGHRQHKIDGLTVLFCNILHINIIFFPYILWDFQDLFTFD